MTLNNLKYIKTFNENTRKIIPKYNINNFLVDSLNDLYNKINNDDILRREMVINRMYEYNYFLVYDISNNKIDKQVFDITDVYNNYHKNI